MRWEEWAINRKQEFKQEKLDKIQSTILFTHVVDMWKHFSVLLSFTPFSTVVTGKGKSLVCLLRPAEPVTALKKYQVLVISMVALSSEEDWKEEVSYNWWQERRAFVWKCWEINYLNITGVKNTSHAEVFFNIKPWTYSFISSHSLQWQLLQVM